MQDRKLEGLVNENSDSSRETIRLLSMLSIQVVKKEEKLPIDDVVVMLPVEECVDVS